MVVYVLLQEVLKLVKVVRVRGVPERKEEGEGEETQEGWNLSHFSYSALNYSESLMVHCVIQ